VDSIRVLIATSEVAPFAKTGGLADVCGALPAALKREGVEPIVMMPAYRSALKSGLPMEPTGVKFDIPIAGKVASGELIRSELPDGTTVYLVRQDDYFDRPELYRENDDDYPDNCERFVFFCRAVLESLRLLEFQADLIHCNDWPTGLIPAFLRLEYEQAQGYQDLASIMTIHNMAYQGVFWHWDMLLTGLDWKHFNYHELEFWGNINLLKAGLVFADALTTVSPKYAEEIQCEPFGCGLEGLLQARSDDLSGIINGVDYDVWNPKIDSFLPAQFDQSNWRSGKAKCKAKLQNELGLPVDPAVPLIGLVGRLADQKGWDLVADVMQQWLPSESAQWAILGSGDASYHELLSQLASDWPQKVGCKLAFSNELAHRIEAGCDMFLMPSQFEPCGLNQLYSLKYGSVPVVRATGGLADTIMNVTPETLEAGSANGFSFQQYVTSSLEQTLRCACEVYTERPEQWGQIVETGMAQDWSWDSSARKYADLYRQTIRRVRSKNKASRPLVQ
jgi:starch synthase